MATARGSSPFGVFSQVADRDVHVFGVGPSRRAAEVVVVAAAGEIAGQALIAVPAGNQRRHRHQLARAEALDPSPSCTMCPENSCADDGMRCEPW